MANVLVVANQTLGGRALLEKVRERNAAGDARWFLVVPQNRPEHGAVIYDEVVRDAAQVRVDLARAYMAREGTEVHGEVGDEDPFTAAMDAIGFWKIDEVIISTLPGTASGWLRRDLIERIHQSSGLPVEHVVTDLSREGLPFVVTLVVANQTAEAEELVERLKQKAAESPDPDLFVVVIPQEHGEGHAAIEARRHLNHVLGTLHSADLFAAGMIGDPDPYTATMNALQAFNVSEVVVSTFSEARSAWLRGGLIDRLRESAAVPVEHITAPDHEEATA